MKLLPLVFKNIKKFVQHKPLLFLFLAISQIVCVIVTLLICGFVDNANRSTKVVQEGLEQFYMSFSSSEETYETIFQGEDGELYTEDEDGNLIPYDVMSTYSEISRPKNFVPKMNELIDFLGDDFSGFAAFGITEDETYYVTGYYEETKYENKEDMEFDMSDEKIVKINPNDDYYKDIYGDNLKVGDKIKVGSEEYIIAENDESNLMSIPYKSLCDDSYITGVYVYTKEACSAERCDEISKKVKKLFKLPDDNVDEPEPRILEELQNIQLAYGVSAAVILMVLLNISRIYSYVLTYRKKSLAVMNICGAGKNKVFFIYLLELMLTLVVSFGIGLLIFHTLLLQPIAALYPNFLISMTPQTYLIIFGIYFVFAILVMSAAISSFIRKSAVDMERSGN